MITPMTSIAKFVGIRYVATGTRQITMTTPMTSIAKFVGIRYVLLYETDYCDHCNDIK